ncbi:MAG: manganese transporter, partial [Paenibacillus sp.]|nr:manganese transporter [Paenibacillus sp.]
LSGLFGGLSGMIGTLISTVDDHLPTGPLSVLAATSLFVVSVLFAPKRGVVSKLLLRASVKRQAKADIQSRSLERRGTA